ncbi:hypothetical protein EV426DRAFT_102519 [Tirmania nivea]|nr:hypothetical protein EV426DRAFT_102519 [Tirmania nivea]
MPIDRKKKVSLNKVTKSLRPMKTERTHEENQERAYIAASRRSDRSLEARVESARRASEIHKKRTGKAFRITEQDVMNEEMYEEEDDDLSARAYARGYVLRNMYGNPDSRLTDYLNHAFYMGNLVQRSVDEQYSRAFPHAPQFPTNYQTGMQGLAPNGNSLSMSTPYSPIQAIYNPLQAAQIAALQQQQQQQAQHQHAQQQNAQQQHAQQQAQQQTFPQQFVRAGVNFHQFQQGPTQTQHQTPRFHTSQMSPQVQTPQMQAQGYNRAQAMLHLAPSMMHPQNFRSPYTLSMKTAPMAPTQLTPQASPVTLPPQIDLGPLSASIPPEAQQFMGPGYSSLFMDVSELRKHNTPDAGQKGQIPIKEEVKEVVVVEEGQEPEQLDTPAESPSEASCQSVPDLADDAVSANNCSPEVFSPVNADMGSAGSFSSSSSKEPSSLLLPNDHITSPTDSSLSMTGFDDIFNLNLDTNYEWMMGHDWTRDAFAM